MISFINNQSASAISEHQNPMYKYIKVHGTQMEILKISTPFHSSFYYMNMMLYFTVCVTSKKPKVAKC